MGERRFVTTELPLQTDSRSSRAMCTTLISRVAWSSCARPNRWSRIPPIARSSSDATGRLPGRRRSFDRGWPAGAARVWTRAGRYRSLVEIAPHESRQVALVLGQGRDMAQASELVARHASLAAASETLAAATRIWDDMLGAIQVSTPDDSFDLIVNRWLPYQTLSGRIWARTGPYQPGGAFGFRINCRMSSP